MVELVKVEHISQLEDLFIKEAEEFQSADEQVCLFAVMVKDVQQGVVAYCKKTKQTLHSVITDRGYEVQTNALLKLFSTL